MRPQQYYKNLLVYIGVIFGDKLTQLEYVAWATVGFVVLCLISSSSYVLNDLKDAEKDRAHPEKASRPIASGVISSNEALIFASLLFILGISITLAIPVNQLPTTHGKFLFLLMVLVVFTTSQSYSLKLKNVVFLDVTLIALNYVWRALAGVLLLDIEISPWLIILGFLGALFLALCKRKADLDFLGEKAPLHKPVFRYYTNELLQQAITITASTLILAYSFYSFFSKTTIGHTYLVITIPLVTFTIFRYLYLLSQGSKVARSPERLFLDKQLLISGLVIFLFFIATIYTNVFDQLLEPLFVSFNDFFNDK